MIFQVSRVPRAHTKGAKPCAHSWQRFRPITHQIFRQIFADLPVLARSCGCGNARTGSAGYLDRGIILRRRGAERCGQPRLHTSGVQLWRTPGKMALGEGDQPAVFSSDRCCRDRATPHSRPAPPALACEPHTSPHGSARDTPDVCRVAWACMASLSPPKAKEKPRPTTTHLCVGHWPWLKKHSPLSISTMYSRLHIRQKTCSRRAVVSGRTRISFRLRPQPGQTSHPSFTVSILPHSLSDCNTFPSHDTKLIYSLKTEN